jgi:hypothetical protein
MHPKARANQAKGHGLADLCRTTLNFSEMKTFRSEDGFLVISMEPQNNSHREEQNDTARLRMDSRGKGRNTAHTEAFEAANLC